MPSTAKAIRAKFGTKYEKLFKVIKLKSHRTYNSKKVCFFSETGLHSNFAQCCYRNVDNQMHNKCDM